MRAISLMVHNTMKETVRRKISWVISARLILWLYSSLPPIFRPFRNGSSRLEQSLDYFYPIKDREQASKQPDRLAIEISEVPSIYGRFSSVEQLKKDLLNKAIMRITIILPTYNEAENLPKLVSALFRFLSTLVCWLSTITARMVLERLQTNSQFSILEIHRLCTGRESLACVPHTWKAFRKLSSLGPEAVVQMDADFSHDPAVLPEMARRIASK